MKILLIITGSIAAKKCINIIGMLIKNKIKIDCLITESAKKIVNTNLIKKSVNGKMYFNSSEKNNKMLHINLTRNSNLTLVCPATANIIAKFANGFANDLASTSLIASNQRILMAPAMNVQMWNNPINKINVEKLKKIGIEFIGPEYGKLSCGEIGMGRLSSEKKIVSIVTDIINKSKKLKNKKCLVTAGPTIEKIDAVRFISNYSSGKQGYEIAKYLSFCGANVTLITGPTNIQPPIDIKVINVVSAEDMYKTAIKLKNVDVAVFAAAVSDIKPKKITDQKRKKNKIKNLSLKINKDIIKDISLRKKNRPKLVVGFAAETKNLLSNCKKKMKEKGCDWIIGNEINKKNEVFGSDFNKIMIVEKNHIKKYKKMTKIDIAKIVVDKIVDYIEN